MSVLTQTATVLAALQDDLERAAARCATVAGHADQAVQAATTLGSTTAIGDAEDIKTAVAVLSEQLQRALSTAGTIRTVIHGEADPNPGDLGKLPREDRR